MKKNKFLVTAVLFVSILFSSSLFAQAEYTGLTAVASDGSNTANMFDNNTGTRWQAENVDNASFVVDLGSTKSVGTIRIIWEQANARDYSISFSTDNITFSNEMTFTEKAAGYRTDNIDVPNLNVRYIKFQGIKRNMTYGYSIYEFDVFPFYTNLAPQGTEFTASSAYGGNTPEKAFDNDGEETRWESERADPQWIMVDLGKMATIAYMTVIWQQASAQDYIIEFSQDGSIWTTVATKTDMPALGWSRVDRFDEINQSARYIRLTGTARTTGYGYSIFEFRLFGEYDTTTGNVKNTLNTAWNYNSKSKLFTVNSAVDFELFSLSGQSIITRQNVEHISLNRLPSGVYFVRLSNDKKETNSIKIVVE